MNYKYRERAVVIEAFQMTEERRWDNQDWPEWLHKAWNRDQDDIGALYIDDVFLSVQTPQGSLRVAPGDWIIQGDAGELYPCKADLFDAFYEPEDGSG